MEPITYRDAGVDIDQAQRALRSVSEDIRSTHSDAVISGIGGFGALFRGSFPSCANPILVSSIDGVGTKTKVAAMVGSYEGLGFDIVNHCVNDILCQGAAPLFFLDYFGASRLHQESFEAVLRGACEACRLVGASLIGGETAEMPGVYADEEVDIVGSIVGVVDYERRLPRSKMQAGDVLIGLASSGLHTNGYSLARRALFEMGGLGIGDQPEGFEQTIGETLLRPHRCYFNSVYPLLQESDAVRAAAHITGGGFYDNLPRVLPSDIQAIIDRRSWRPPAIFELIQSLGQIHSSEMYRAFNMGIGMVLVVDHDYASECVAQLVASGEQAAIIGEVASGGTDVSIV